MRRVYSSTCIIGERIGFDGGAPTLAYRAGARTNANPHTSGLKDIYYIHVGEINNYKHGKVGHGKWKEEGGGVGEHRDRGTIDPIALESKAVVMVVLVVSVDIS